MQKVEEYEQYSPYVGEASISLPIKSTRYSYCKRQNLSEGKFCSSLAKYIG